MLDSTDSPVLSEEYSGFPDDAVQLSGFSVFIREILSDAASSLVISFITWSERPDEL